MNSDFYKRMSQFSGYFFMSNVTKKNRFKEFSDCEYFNMVIQILCFIFEKSIARQICLKTHLDDFLTGLNAEVYKKNLSLDDISKLSGDILNALKNNGKPYVFNVYEKDSIIPINIEILNDKIVRINGEDRISYSLTDCGYKLLLATKEYDEMFKIKVSQIIARMRIEQEDYLGAIDEVNDIKYALEVQWQKIDNYIEFLKADITYIKKNDFGKMLLESLDVLIEESERYSSLHSYVNEIIVDKENALDRADKKLIERIKGKLETLKVLIELIREVQATSSKLVKRLHLFEDEFKEALNAVLRMNIGDKLDFKESIMDKLESSDITIENLHSLFSPIFRINNKSIFFMNTPYNEQFLLKAEKTKRTFVQDDIDIDKSRKVEEAVKCSKTERIYAGIFKRLMEFAGDKDKFYLKDFINFYVRNHQREYLELFKDSNLVRNIFMELATIENIIFKDIEKEIEKVGTSPSIEFNIHNIYSEVTKKDSSIKEAISSVNVKQNKEEIQINTNINIELMEAVKLTVPNLEFNIK